MAFEGSEFFRCLSCRTRVRKGCGVAPNKYIGANLWCSLACLQSGPGPSDAKRYATHADAEAEATAIRSGGATEAEATAIQRADTEARMQEAEATPPMGDRGGGSN